MSVSQLEKRQAKRMVRLTMQLERQVFELITEMQELLHPDAPDYDWHSACEHVEAIRQALPLLGSLASDTLREVMDRALLSRRITDEGGEP